MGPSVQVEFRSGVPSFGATLTQPQGSLLTTPSTGEALPALIVARRLEARINLLISQWADSPLLQALPRLSVDRGNEVLAALARLELMRTIDGAEGIWLDYIGSRLGCRRPAVTSPSDDPRFGFEGVTQARPFGVAPFRGMEENAAIFPLNDEVYRLILKARGITLVSHGTLPEFETAVHLVDPIAVIFDNRDMTVTVRTDDSRNLEIADDCDCLPRPGGVDIIYQSLTAFGFEGAGVGFDQGPFRGWE